MSDVTRILSMIEAGDQQAAEELLPLVYDELRRLARFRMAGERADHTLQATALVHEAYVRLVQPDGDRSWKDRRHFFVAAAEAMRRILITAARRKKALKRGGDREPADMDIMDVACAVPAERLLDLDEALEELDRQDPIKAELVKLRFFGGLTSQEAAETLGISDATASRYWAYARAWLQCALAE